MGDAHDITQYLLKLASSLAASQQPLKAIKCLEAVLRQSLLPTLEVQTRLQAARLLLDHTDCLAPAREHLQKAEQRLSKVPNEVLLKLEVAATLAEAYQHLGQRNYQQQALQAGLRYTCTDPSNIATSKLPEWSCYFLLHLARAAAVESPAQALQVAAQGQAVAEQHGLLKEQVLFLLLQLQLHTATWCREGAEAALAALEPLAEQLPAAAGAPNLTPLCVAQLQVHHRLMQALFFLKLGRFVGLHVKAAPGAAPQDSPNLLPLLDTLVPQLAAAVAAAEQQGAQRLQEGLMVGGMDYDWLPMVVIQALVALLWAHVHKARGEVADAKKQLEQGLVAVQEELQRLQVTPTSLPRLHHSQHQLAGQLLSLQQLLWDCQLQVFLLNTDFAAAQQVLGSSLAAVDAYPAQLGAFLPQAHLAAGLYALALEEYGAAQSHFAAAGQAGEEALFRPACQALGALALLGLTGPVGVAQAAQALGEFYATHCNALGYSERALAGLAAGLAQLHQGQPLDAKQRLGQALNLTYKQLTNNQLVAQVLGVMAPQQMGSESNFDRAGAKEMVKTAVVLSRGAGDLRTLTGTLRVTQQVLERSNEAASTAAAQNSNYLLKKQQELAGRLQAVGADAALQQQVLQWRLA